MPTPTTHRLRLFEPRALVAAMWTVIALGRVRRALRHEGFAARVTAPPRLPSHAGRGVGFVLRRLDRTCLERAFVEQAWLTAHGRPTDVVIGVTTEDGEVKAHAWLAGRADMEAERYDEIHRISPGDRG